MAETKTRTLKQLAKDAEGLGKKLAGHHKKAADAMEAALTTGEELARVHAQMSELHAAATPAKPARQKAAAAPAGNGDADAE